MQNDIKFWSCIGMLSFPIHQDWLVFRNGIYCVKLLLQLFPEMPSATFFRIYETQRSLNGHYK